MRALEEELGGELLERRPRSVRLTSAGKAFLPRARAAVNSAERAVRSAREALQLKTGAQAFLELMRARPWQYPPLDATVIA